MSLRPELRFTRQIIEDEYDRAPTALNPALRQSYYNNISSILTGSKNQAGGNPGAATDCQQCTSTFQTLHTATEQLSPADITGLLVDLCNAGYQMFESESCQALYAGASSEGPYLAKLYCLLETDDIEAFCKYNQKIECSSPSVVKIKEPDWFSAKPALKEPKTSSGRYDPMHVANGRSLLRQAKHSMSCTCQTFTWMPGAF